MDRALGLATRHALATQWPDGSWSSLPGPRITETALCTLALARSPHPGADRAAERGRVWLAGGAVPQDHHPVAQAVEAALLSLALGTGGPIDVSHPSFADRALSARARLIQAIALHTGRATHGGTGPAALRTLLASALATPGRLKRWTRVELWAAHALVEAAHGNRPAARRAARAIADEQSPAGDFFANPVTTALAALALQAAAPGTAAALGAARNLITGQHPDGTWRFATSDVWDTALTVRAFRGAAAFDRRGLPAAVAFLVEAQNPDGGWPYRSGVESDNDTTAAALIALGGASGVPGTTVGAALRHLAGQQTPDGLWRTWQSAGDPPVDDVIAHVVTALDRHQGRHRTRSATARRWLAERLRTQGRWHAGWYRGLPYATAEVLPAVGAAALEVGHPAARALAETRNPDGGWPVEAGGPSAPAATGLALAALERGGLLDAGHWAEGLAYLLETQRADGTWPGVPLMYGPRPLLTHFPTHTHAFAADGLFAGKRRLAAAHAPQEG
ncbi:Squalene--hopene cyclase [Streptomyces sp. YIM 121038]|uniref:prenyltransferase/squalene oxidase repeat-containing protein n=1 Tax=Streptomyces sp. YIM 121038 TaxID=2136401 RepID=UPI001110DEF0|nr:prenyltransferase/squalene oxidase repeat-containing protein [Streptomyces sp. YIM 121038]QCX81535.1 Squalene--hopene cyclase [Streptomyces sp. YIM 121038]